MKQFILLYLLIFIANLSYSQSQVKIAIENMTYIDGTTITSCGTIDFEDNPTVRIQFTVELEKPNALVAGNNCTLNIYTKKTSSSFEFSHENRLYSEASWSIGDPQYITEPFDITLNASDFNVGGGIFYAEFVYSNGSIKKRTCNYSIEKDPIPTFELDDDSYTISCGSTADYTFTVNNKYNSPGTLSYSWNVGSGWNRDGNPVSGSFTTTTNSITLKPRFGTVLPSDVTVTTTLDGNTYPPTSTLTAMVTRADYEPANQIIGSNQLCSTATYAVNNLPPGTTLSSWTSSDPSVATMATNNKNKGVLTAVSNGIITVSATLTNACGQSAIITTNNIAVGAPAVTNYGMSGNSSNIYTNSVSYYSVSPVPGVTSYYWWITPAGGCSAGSGPTINNMNPYTSANTSVQINWGACPGDYSVVCWAENSCGTTSTGQKFVTVKDINEPCDNNFSLRVSPNPNKGKKIGVTVNLVPNPEPCPTSSLSSTTNKEYHVEVYDFYGMKRFSGDYKSEKMTLGNLSLKKGAYIVKVTSSSGINESKTLIID